MVNKSNMRYVLSIDQAEEYFKNGQNEFYIYHHSVKELMELMDLADKYRYLSLSTVNWNVSQFVKRN